MFLQNLGVWLKNLIPKLGDDLQDNVLCRIVIWLVIIQEILQ